MIMGKEPPEGWTNKVSTTLLRPELSQFLRKGRGAINVVSEPTEKSGGFTVRSRGKKNPITGDEGPDTELKVRFGEQGRNKAAADLQNYFENADFSQYHFSPTRNVNTQWLKGRDSHISLIEYDDNLEVLQVTFSNGTVVAYYHVPISVYVQLYTAQKNHQSVGGIFWNLVRVYDRANLPIGGPYGEDLSNFVQPGAKYPYIYTERGVKRGRSKGQDRGRGAPAAEPPETGDAFSRIAEAARRGREQTAEIGSDIRRAQQAGAQTQTGVGQGFLARATAIRDAISQSNRGAQ